MSDKKAIWGQLLASKAEIIQKYAFFNFNLTKSQVEKLSALYTVSLVCLFFCFVLFCSLPRRFLCKALVRRDFVIRDFR